MSEVPLGLNPIPCQVKGLLAGLFLMSEVPLKRLGIKPETLPGEGTFDGEELGESPVQVTASCFMDTLCIFPDTL